MKNEKELLKEELSELRVNEICEKALNMCVKYNRAIKGLKKFAHVLDETLDEYEEIMQEFEKLGLDIEDYKVAFDGIKEIMMILKEFKKIKV